MISLTDYLIKKYSYTKSRVKKLYKYKEVYVNDKLVKMDTLINENDKVEIKKTKEVLLDNNKKLEIIYEDKNYLVVNKPSGLLTVATDKEKENTLYHEVREYVKSINKNNYIYIVHRLDKDTSGLMLVAKNDWTHDKLSKMIKDKEVKRVYLALVDGVINHDTGTIEAPIGRDPKDREKMMVTDINSKEARTNFKVLKRYKNHTLIECILDTGRTHQIRVHMKYIGFPVTNDPLYGKCFNKEFGQMLHSKEIDFKNPRDNKRIHFEVDAPDEFYEILNSIEETV